MFGIVWCFLFALYFPAAKAGFVTDFTGWLDQVRNHSFSEHINRTNYQAKSLYQFTQLATYVFYKLFGTNAWLWHLLFITLHAANVCLAYVFCTRLLKDAGAEDVVSAPLAGVVLYCVSPYMSEVIVWEPAFHFLQGLLFILLILLLVQRFMVAGERKFALYAGLLYLLSAFSLEVFYITPWLVLAVVLFYRSVDAGYRVRPAIPLFVVPMFGIFLLRLLAFRALYGGWVSRVGSTTITSVTFHSFGKPAKYLFHLLFVGRFFDEKTRQDVYDVCEGTGGIIVFWGIAIAALLYIVAGFRKMSGNGRVAALLYVLAGITLVLLIPVWFSDGLLVVFDRYTYFTAAFLYMLVGLWVIMIPRASVRIVLLLALISGNLRFAIQVSRYWGKSEKVISSLLTGLPEAGDKKILLLNLPENMHGVAMIGSERNSEFKLMHDLLYPDKPIRNTVFDVLSYNMVTPDDGAHAVVMSDSTIQVTLNQWGTWWWFETRGGHSYENEDYKVDLTDPGHQYMLILKKPAADYMLLYQAGDHWKQVDMTKKGVEQH